MDVEIGLAGHGLGANLTDVLALWPRRSVRLHVHQQHLLPREPFVAQLASVLLGWWHVVRLMKLRVQSQALAIPESGVADFTNEWLLSGVRQLMLLVACPRVESSCAYLTVVRVVEIVQSLMIFQILTMHTGKAACITDVHFNTGMGLQVFPQRDCRVVAATALVTSESIYSVSYLVFVTLHVQVQLVVGDKCFAAQRALQLTIRHNQVATFHFWQFPILKENLRVISRIYLYFVALYKLVLLMILR